MKKLSQVKKFVSQCNFDKDWIKVKTSCDKMFGKGLITKPQRPISNATFDDFSNWLESEYSVGDIVIYGNTVGVLNAVTPERVSLGAYYIRNNEKILFHTLLIDKDRIRKASNTIIKQFNKDLYKHGMVIDQTTLNIVESFTPKINTVVEAHQDGKIYVGIVKNIEKTKISFHIITIQENDYLGYKRNAICTITPDTTFNTVTGKKLKAFHEYLKDKGYKWTANKLTKTIKRAKIGERYYYFTEQGTIKSAIEMNTRLSDTRYKALNYFISMEEAAIYNIKIQQLLEQRIALD